MLRKIFPTSSPSLLAAGNAHTDVHRALRRYFELAQDFIVASLAIVLLGVMVQGVGELWQLAFISRRSPSEVLSQIVLLLVLVELFRTLILYLSEHRVAVPLMLEVAIVSELREVLLNQPTALNAQLYANAILLLVLGSLLIAYRVARAGAQADPADGARAGSARLSAPSGEDS